MAEADPTFKTAQFMTSRAEDIITNAHKTRSIFLDRFALLESELHELCKALKVKSEIAAPLGGRLESLRKATEIDNKRRAKLDALLDDLAEFASQRADIVHAAIRVVQDIQHHELRVEFLSVPVDHQRCLSLTVKEFEALPGSISALANRLRQFRSAPILTGRGSPTATTSAR